MNKDKEKHFTLRVDEKVWTKFRYVCDEVCRTANRQLIQLILKCIADYEEEWGEISPNDNQ